MDTLPDVAVNKFQSWTSQLLGTDVAGWQVFTSVNRRGQPLGSIVVHNYRPGFNAEIAIATTKIGLTRPLIRYVIAYLFGQLGLPRISIIVRATDASQLGIVKRLGFIAEGQLIDWYGPGIHGIHFRLTLQQLLASKFGKILEVHYERTRDKAT